VSPVQSIYGSGIENFKRHATTKVREQQRESMMFRERRTWPVVLIFSGSLRRLSVIQGRLCFRKELRSAL
jgi:hypothetical protein